PQRPAPPESAGLMVPDAGGVETDENAQDIPLWQGLAESPLAYHSCRFSLHLLGVRHDERPPVTSAENPDCGIARPLHITEIQPGIAIAGGAIMR
ncbi:MAG: hypothetical protein Q4G26_09155, partial [Paracoccus sp. (in: a-proteobacteria)]|nr:hypothetical protein [Paracoccus sp. (in: a-proteobacteria)]